MPTIEIILRDDAGQVIDGRSVKKYPLDCQMKTFLTVNFHVMAGVSSAGLGRRLHPTH